MSIGRYEASVPVFLRYLDRLGAILGSAESHVRERRLDPSALLAARLAPDMLPLESQAAIAAHFALRACFPLAGQDVPPFGEFPATFGGLHARIDRVVRLLRGLEPGQFAGAELPVITSQAGDAVVSLDAPAFLLQYALPNFFFHVTAAYAILRSQGVPLGKEQFDGFHAYPVPPPETSMNDNTPPSQFLVISRGQWDADKSPEEIQKAIDDFYIWYDRLVREGKVKPGQRLATQAKRVSRSGTTDGPFAEAKEVIGGYWFFMAANLEEAAALAAQNPCLACGLGYEVRPIELERASAFRPGNETPRA